MGMRQLPTLQYEQNLWNQGYTVVGIDEVGRGAFAGPIYVSAVAFTPTQDSTEINRLCTLGINDSKKLTPAKRTELNNLLSSENIVTATAQNSSTIINTYGIMHALNQAIMQVISEIQHKLSQKRLAILLDGTNIPSDIKRTPYPHQAIPKGDSLSLSIAAASIMAKVARDKYMTQLGEEYPHYNWGENKGYGTLDHREAIIKHGACTHHRILYLRKLKGTLNEKYENRS